MPPPLSHAPAKTCHSLSLLTWQSLAWLLFHSSLYPFPSYEVPLSRVLCMTIFMPSSSSDNDDLFPPHLSHPSFPLWLRSVPSPQHTERLMLIRLVNPEGEELETGMETKTVIDTGTCICMNTHICIISERKWYKYTQTHTHTQPAHKH